MMATTVTALDSQGRSWRCTGYLDGHFELDPIGHDTDPESSALSMADYEALADRVLPRDEPEHHDDGDTARDRANDRFKESRLAA